MYGGIDCEFRSLLDVELGKEVPFSVWTSLRKITKASLLPKQSFGEERPLQEADFTEFRRDVTFGFKTVCDFLNKIVSSNQTSSMERECVLDVLILCAEHASADLWTTEETCSLSASCINSLCTFYGCEMLLDLLLGQTSRAFNPCFKQLILLLRPKLCRETWRQYPSAVSAFKCFLSQVPSPHLSEHLALVSPTALIIIDDHDLQRRLIGLHCLSHIIDNVARTELCQQGFDQVFFKTLQPMLWQRDASQTTPVVDCLCKLLNKTQRGYTRRVELGMWDLFDDTLRILLERMAFEDDISLRIAYIKSLRTILSVMGPSVIRWSKPLLSVLDEYLNKTSFDTRKEALEVLRIYLGLSTLRIPKNGEIILFLLLRTLQDISTEIKDHKCTDLEILETLTECITMVKKAAPVEFESIKSELLGLEYNALMQSVLFKCS